LSIDPVLARVIQALFTYIAIMTINIIVMTMRMRTGIYADPSSIAAVAALTHHPYVLDDFRTFSDEATSRDIVAHLENKRYKLDEYIQEDGTWRYGVVPVGQSRLVQYNSADKPFPIQNSKPKYRRWRIIDLCFDILFALVLLGLLGLVAAYYKDGKNDGFNRFFNKMTFGPRFILTGTGTLISINWKRLERGM